LLDILLWIEIRYDEGMFQQKAFILFGMIHQKNKSKNKVRLYQKAY
jgi:hypothetical protein